MKQLNFKKFSTKNLTQKGFGAMELMVVIAIVVTTVVSLIQFYNLFLHTSKYSEDYAQAVLLAQEAYESVRIVRDFSWDTVSSASVGTAYHAETVAVEPGWVLAAGNETIGKFSRSVQFSDVYRDGNDNIVEVGGVLDPETKKVNMTVSWSDRGKTHTVDLYSYLTNWQEE